MKVLTNDLIAMGDNVTKQDLVLYVLGGLDSNCGMIFLFLGFDLNINILGELVWVQGLIHIIPNSPSIFVLLCVHGVNRNILSTIVVMT